MIKESLRNRIRFRVRVMIRNRVGVFLSVIFSSGSRLRLGLGLCHKLRNTVSYVDKVVNGRIMIFMRKVMSIVIVRFSCGSLLELGVKVVLRTGLELKLEL